MVLRSFRFETRNGIQKKSGLRKAADLFRRARMNSRERRFAAAVERGQARARKELESA
jgi:hypothetical protein